MFSKPCRTARMVAWVPQLFHGPRLAGAVTRAARRVALHLQPGRFTRPVDPVCGPASSAAVGAFPAGLYLVGVGAASPWCTRVEVAPGASGLTVPLAVASALRFIPAAQLQPQPGEDAMAVNDADGLLFIASQVTNSQVGEGYRYLRSMLFE